MTDLVLTLDDGFEVPVAIDRERSRGGCPGRTPPHSRPALIEIADCVLVDDSLGIRPIVRYRGRRGCPVPGQVPERDTGRGHRFAERGWRGWRGSWRDLLVVVGLSAVTARVRAAAAQSTR